jgi:pentatricopeptide repeat protein
MLHAVLYSGGGIRRLPSLIPHHRLMSGSSVAAIFSQPSPPADPTAAIHSAGLDLSHPNTIPALLVHPDLASNYPAASRFFSWATSNPDTAVLNSKCFNSMLQLAAANGDADQFWSLVTSMRSKGYGLSKTTLKTATESFRSKDMSKDAGMIQSAFTAHARNAAVAEACKILRSDADELSKLDKLNELGVDVTDELVALVVEKVGQFPQQAMVFFAWVEQSAGAGIGWGKVYNAMAKAIGQEDCIEEFRDVLRKMSSKELGMDKEVYVTLVGRFLKRKMFEDAVDLFRFAMGGTEKPSAEDFVFLLKKVVVRDDLDLKMVMRVVRIYQKAGNEVKHSVFDAVIKSLRSMGRLGESGRVLKAMEDGGFAPDSTVHGKAVLAMCDAGNLEDARKHLARVEKSGYKLDPVVWSALVKKYSLGDDVDMAVACFPEMLERQSGNQVGCALEVLVSGLCKKKEAKEAFKVLKDLVVKYAVVPWQSTYKYLIHKLIRQGHLNEAFDVLGLMKTNDLPPYIDPLISHISKSGTVEDALGLLKAMTSKEFPSRTVYKRLFQGLFKEGRHEIAQQLLLVSPGSVRNHAEVLDLFYTKKLQEEPAAAAAAL